MNIENYTSKLSSDKFVIFLLHGVIKQEVSNVRNYNRKHILEAEFYSLLKELKNKGNPFSMNDLLSGKPLPQNAYTITFDDGFENNFSVAAPILKELKTPATFYVTSSFVNDNKMSWIDQIDYAIEKTEQNEITFMGRQFKLTSVKEKIIFLKYVRQTAKASQSFFLAKQKHISDIFEQTRVSFRDSLDSPIDLKMSWNQVFQLSQDELFTIGGHTHTHCIMSFLDDKDLTEEIELNIQFLRKNCLFDVDHFSYPEGLDFCFNEKVIHKLKYAGIKCCPTAIDGSNNINDNLFYLRRVNII